MLWNMAWNILWLISWNTQKSIIHLQFDIIYLCGSFEKAYWNYLQLAGCRRVCIIQFCNVCVIQLCLIESIKTTSMEKVSTGVQYIYSQTYILEEQKWIYRGTYICDVCVWMNSNAIQSVILFICSYIYLSLQIQVPSFVFNFCTKGGLTVWKIYIWLNHLLC